jgi:hypothetical protein
MSSDQYPLIQRPEAGTVIYPLRRGVVFRRSEQETLFLEQLRKWLPPGLEVLDDVCINLSDKLPPMVPDIVVRSKEHHGVRIDVEIDESYDAKTLKPLHFVTCGDGFYDLTLSRYGWTIVRFAVRQVRDNPRACADYLMHILQQELPTLSWTDLQTEPLEPVSRWTQTEALKMAFRRSETGQNHDAPLSPLPYNDDECRCQQQVRPMPRTAAMQQKMAGFRDAGRYPLDLEIDFEPEEHIYTCYGHRQLVSVSAIIGHFFERFDALSQAIAQWDRYKKPVEESLDIWDRIGRLASEVGTFLHEQTENYFQRGFFEDECVLRFGDKEERVSVRHEKQQFLNFIRDYQIEPYRQEWPIFDSELNIAGTIDLICRNDDGTFTIYDWKRSAKVVNGIGNPIIEGYRGKKSHNGLELPDTPYFHYCVQQNLYRYMLQRYYGVQVRDMNLVVLHPDYPDYFVVPVPAMDDVVNRIVELCIRGDLGHRLLKR